MTELSKTNYPITVQNVASLNDAEEAPIPFNAEYLSVQGMQAGTKIRCIFLRVYTSERFVEDRNSEKREMKIKNVECVQFLCSEDGKAVVRENAGKMLVGKMKELVKQGILEPAKTALSLEFKGLQPNKTNSNLSAQWDIRPLLIKSN